MAKPKATKNPFAGISNVKLKKAKEVNDRSAAQLTGYLTNQQIEEYDQYIESFDIEQWYQPLKDITFPTKYVKLTFEEGSILKQTYEQITKLNKQINATEDADLQTKLRADMKSIDLSKLDDLASRINAVINEWKLEEHKNADYDNENDFGVFVKLSSRSAKDATDAEERLQMLFTKYCEQNNATTNNDRVCELLKAATHCMKVQNAKQVISMFIHSERIHHDISGALKYGKEKFTQNVVIRKWIPIDIDMEFRGFVYKSKLNALSQYNHFIHFKRLTQMKDVLQKKLQTFFDEKVKKKLEKYEGYVIDFAVCGKDLDNVLIIELNPFMQSTDAALFSWKEEMELLKNGPFEFRVRNDEPTKQIHISYKYRVLLGWEK